MIEMTTEPTAPVKKEPILVNAVYVSRTGLDTTLNVSKGQGLPEGEQVIKTDIQIIKVLNDKNKVQAGNAYTFKISYLSSGNPFISNVGPAEPAEGFKTGKEILQENIDAARKEPKPEPVKESEPAPAPVEKPKRKAPAAAKKDVPAGVKDLPEACKTCIYVHDCATLVPIDKCKQQAEAAINLAKQEQEVAARKKENEDAVKQMVAEKQAKDALQKQKAASTAELIKEVEKTHQNESVSVPEASKPQQQQAVVMRQAPAQMVESTQMTFSEEQIKLIKGMVAKDDLSDFEFGQFMYLASVYHLDPVRHQIWCVKYNGKSAQIFTGRDGFLQIAHRSGQFNGMKSWVEYAKDNEGKDDLANPIKGHCIVHRKDMEQPFESEVLFREYSTGMNLWKTKPSVMILKCAESVCLRKSFAIDGLYSPEEVGES